MTVPDVSLHVVLDDPLDFLQHLKIFDCIPQIFFIFSCMEVKIIGLDASKQLHISLAMPANQFLLYDFQSPEEFIKFAVSFSELLEVFQTVLLPSSLEMAKLGSSNMVSVNRPNINIFLRESTGTLNITSSSADLQIHGSIKLIYESGVNNIEFPILTPCSSWTLSVCVLLIINCGFIQIILVKIFKTAS
jgi:hypothetical protein